MPYRPIKDIAADLRAALKKAYPGITFRAVSKSYTGGSRKAESGTWKAERLLCAMHPSQYAQLLTKHGVTPCFILRHAVVSS